MADEEKAPWFPLHSKLWKAAKKKLSPRDIVAMIDLLEACWSGEKCSIPSSKEGFISIVPEKPDDFKSLLDFFIDHPDLNDRLTNPYLFAEFHSKKKTAPKKAEKKDPGLQAPLWKNCQYFRMTEEEHSQVKRVFSKRGYPHEWIPLAVSEIETWLSGASLKAVKERSCPTHYRRVFAAWVIENVVRGLKAKGQFNHQQLPKKLFYFKAPAESQGGVRQIGDILTQLAGKTNEPEKRNDGQ